MKKVLSICERRVYKFHIKWLIKLRQVIKEQLSFFSSPNKNRTVLAVFLTSHYVIVMTPSSYWQQFFIFIYEILQSNINFEN